MTLPPTSDVAACHRVVRRHTCCSPATRRSMRATQARAAPGVNVDQPAPKAASQPSHEAHFAAPRSAWGRTVKLNPCPKLRIDTTRRGLKVSVLIMPRFGRSGSPLHSQDGPLEEQKKVSLGVRLKPTRHASKSAASYIKSFVKTAIIFRVGGCGGVSFAEFLGSCLRGYVTNSIVGIREGPCPSVRFYTKQRSFVVVLDFWPPLGRERAFCHLPRRVSACAKSRIKNAEPNPAGPQNNTQI